MVNYMIKKYCSIVNEEIKEKIDDAKWAESLVQYASYKCEIDGLIAAAALFCPDIIEIDGYIFIKQFWNIDNEEESLVYIKKLEKQFGLDKKKIEKYVNTWSLGDFFIGNDSCNMNDIDVLRQFGNTLCYFWKIRLYQLFPNKQFEIALESEIEGEMGLCIFMYEL